MQTLTTTPASTLIQMGSLNTHLGGCLYYKGPVLKKIMLGFLGSPTLCNLVDFSVLSSKDIVFLQSIMSILLVMFLFQL